MLALKLSALGSSKAHGRIGQAGQMPFWISGSAELGTNLGAQVQHSHRTARGKILQKLS